MNELNTYHKESEITISSVVWIKRPSVEGLSHLNLI